eukprot:12576770-Prorocentrum_lima.AAC.1
MQAPVAASGSAIAQASVAAPRCVQLAVQSNVLGKRIRWRRRWTHSGAWPAQRGRTGLDVENPPETHEAWAKFTP